VPTFAQTRQVIAFERQGHGHTADIDRPFSLEQWADDTAALLQHLNIEQADILGYSTGGSVALAFALRYPKMVSRLVLASAIYNREGYYPGIMEGLLQATAEDMPDILREMYSRVAPYPENWSQLVKKSVESVAEFKGWQKKDIRTISAPTLVIVGDSDIVRTEHAVDLYRLIPNAKLAVLPDTDHVGILVQHAAWTAGMITEFLSTPMPETAQPEQPETLEHDFPKSLGRPATDALLAAGYTRLEQLTRVRESDIKALHGIGPQAIKILSSTLAEKGLSFANRQ
jgi:pimeloyl-ACP methyl ester carboxylesterase